MKKQTLLCTIGTVFEWYEFSLFASLTPIISALFFPKNNPLNAMMLTFALFASGFIMRPVGAIFFGHLGDKFGRKSTMLLTIFLMAGATTCIGLIPVGGAFSPLLLLMCRLTQGFATSGEYPGGLVLLAEQTSEKRRGLVTNLIIFGTGMGGFAATAIYTITLKCLGHENMLLWGWRIPFLLGAPLGLCGALLRKNIIESPVFEKIKQHQRISSKPILQLLSQHKKTLLCMVCLSTLANTTIYVIHIYLSNYAYSMHHINMTEVTYSFLFVTLLYSVFNVMFGFISDYVNRKALLAAGCLSLILFSYPLVHIATSQSIVPLFFADGALVFMLGMIVGPLNPIITSSFPSTIRYTGVSLTLNIAASFFGGTSPMVCTWLTQQLGTPLAPAYYLIALAMIALTALIVFVLNESRSCERDNDIGLALPETFS